MASDGSYMRREENCRRCYLLYRQLSCKFEARGWTHLDSHGYRQRSGASRLAARWCCTHCRLSERMRNRGIQLGLGMALDQSESDSALSSCCSRVPLWLSLGNLYYYPWPLVMAFDALAQRYLRSHFTAFLENFFVMWTACSTSCRYSHALHRLESD